MSLQLLIEFLADYPGVKVSPDGSVYICGGDNVVVYTSDGKFVRELGAGTFQAPSDVAFKADGRLIYVTDWYARVSVFNADGKHSHYIGKHGDGPTEIHHPAGTISVRV